MGRRQSARPAAQRRMRGVHSQSARSPLAGNSGDGREGHGTASARRLAAWTGTVVRARAVDAWGVGSAPDRVAGECALLGADRDDDDPRVSLQSVRSVACWECVL